MIRMSRAGRKALMLAALCRHDKRYPKGCMTTAKLAHAAGLMSSTEVVKMLREMASTDIVREVQIEPSYQCGYTVRAWQLVRWEQSSLPNDHIVINGTKYNRETMEVV
jgi:hypothetical protein